MSITKKFFGNLSDGRVADIYTLTNAAGMEVSITTYGGALVSVKAPDKFGRMSDVVLGFDSLYDYENSGGSLGALVGRFANRIAKGCFELDGVVYDKLYINNRDNHLHGGKAGFGKRIWTVLEADDSDEPSLVLNYIAEDGEENYPGRLDVTVTYTLGEDNALTLVYKATTDKPTIINLTNHVYFNLGGCASGDIFDHVLTLDAESYLEPREGLIPTGNFIDVEGTPMDFRTPKTIGKDFYADYADLKTAGGYDHCFNFTGWRDQKADDIPLRATVLDPKSGRVLKMFTNQPCVQLYTANFLNNPDHPLKNGCPQKTQTGFCLETQVMPDSINHEGFTNCILRPGEEYCHVTTFEFSVED